MAACLPPLATVPCPWCCKREKTAWIGTRREEQGGGDLVVKGGIDWIRVKLCRIKGLGKRGGGLAGIDERRKRTVVRRICKNKTSPNNTTLRSGLSQYSVRFSRGLHSAFAIQIQESSSRSFSYSTGCPVDPHLNYWHLNYWSFQLLIDWTIVHSNY